MNSIDKSPVSNIEIIVFSLLLIASDTSFVSTFLCVTTGFGLSNTFSVLTFLYVSLLTSA